MALSIEGKDTDLRSRLVIEGETISDHCDRVAALKSEFGHAITCVDQPSEGTCATHALSLFDGFYKLCEELEGRGVKADTAFLNWLVDEQRLEELSGAETGALSLYFKDGTCKHAAVAVGGERMRSKWGSYPVYEHQPSETPADYGNALRFFRAPSPRVAAELLLEFGCRQLGAEKAEEVESLRGITGMSAKGGKET